MAPQTTPLALSWSGGKDSALALWVLREELGTEPVALLTTITEDYDRISMHAVRSELLRAQARATRIELVEIPIPAGCVNATYEERMELALTSPPLDQIPTIAFGDLFLEDVRAYRETRLLGADRSARSSRSGAATPPPSHGSSSRPASRRPSSASIPTSSIPPSSAAASTRRCLPSSPPASTPAARTASSTPSSTPARFSGRRSRSSSARRSCATASPSRTSSCSDFRV